MIGYGGVEQLVFNVLSRTLSQADLDISVQLDEASAHTKSTDVYDLNASSTRAEGIQTARTNLHRMMEEMLKGNEISEEGKMSASLACPVLLRIQPFFDDVWSGNEKDLFATAEDEKVSSAEKRHLHVLVWWADPKHKLSHVTCSQAIPSWWRMYTLSNNSVYPSCTESVGRTDS